MNVSSLLLFGGLAFFLYGTRLVRIGLQELSEDRLRALISNATQSRFAAVAVGILITVILQSSSATTVMLVGFANTGLITLTQAMGVLLGAGLGTALTVQLISFHFADWSLVFVTIGVLLGIIWRHSKLAHLGNVVLGFGLIFYGMNLMAAAVLPVRESPAFQQLLTLLDGTPVLLLVAAAFFTALVQNSAVVIGIALSLAQSGVMTLEVALPVVLGANIGTCFAALISGLGSEPKGRRVAYAHLAFRVLGTAIIFPLMPYFAELVRVFTRMVTVGDSTVLREIANAHLLFNLILSVVFLPFTGWAARLLERYVPDKSNGKDANEFRARFLDENALDTPALAQGCVTQETIRTAGIVHDMLKDSLDVYEHPSDEQMEKIEAADDRVDFLDRQIRFYIAKIAQRSLTKEQAARQLHLLNITTNLESMGDIINRDLIKLAKKLRRKNVAFSREGWEEIRDFYSKVIENFSLALASFSDNNPELAHKVIRHERTMGELETVLKQNHLARLQAGLKESFDTSSVHLELLAELRRINSLLTVLSVAVVNRQFTT